MANWYHPARPEKIYCGFISRGFEVPFPSLSFSTDLAASIVALLYSYPTLGDTPNTRNLILAGYALQFLPTSRSNMSPPQDQDLNYDLTGMPCSANISNWILADILPCWCKSTVNLAEVDKWRPHSLGSGASHHHFCEFSIIHKLIGWRRFCCCTILQKRSFHRTFAWPMVGEKLS